MFMPIARSYVVFDLADGESKTDFGVHFPTYIEVINDSATDAEIIINDNNTGGIPVKAGTTRFIFVRTAQLIVKGADVRVIGYYV